MYLNTNLRLGNVKTRLLRIRSNHLPYKTMVLLQETTSVTSENLAVIVLQAKNPAVVKEV